MNRFFMVSVISVVLMMAFLNLSAENNKSIKNTKQTELISKLFLNSNNKTTY